MASIMSVILLLLPMTTAHLSLTYPPVRYPPLDYLRISRSSFPCGVPRPPTAAFTTLYTHTPYNFTFRIAYPHQGGCRLALYDADGILVQNLWPKGDGYAGLEDQSVQTSDEIMFLKPCQQCIVRVVRQAIEKKDALHSCADVNVVDGSPQGSREKCFNAGNFVDEKCQCDPLRSGPVCQYEDFCITDKDCQNGGQCVEEQHSITRKTCFCAFGFFGRNCEQKSEKSASDVTTKCFNYDYPDSEQSFDEHGLFKKQCYKKEEINADDVVYHRNIRDEVEVILDYASNSWVGLGWKPMDINISCRNFPVEIEHDHIASESIACDNSTVSLHPMHCLDLVVGSVFNGRSRIGDYYTRDQSTPLLDSWYHGTDSLLAAYGIRRDGRTLIMFRRKIAASEKSDHPLGPGEVFAVWAKGQEYGSYYHDPPSAIETKAVGDSHFYKPNELKYHGGLNRGVYPMEFVTIFAL